MLCRNPRAPEIYYTALYEFPDRRESRADYTALPRPTHNVAIILRGRGIMTEGENTVEVQPGEILFIPKHDRYKSIWTGDPDIRFQTVHFDYTWQNDPLRGKRIPVQKLPLAVTEDILADYAFLLKHQSDTGADAFAGVSRFFGLCAKLFAHYAYEPLDERRSIQPALDYIEQNYRQSIRVRELAALCCLSESRFYTCFKNETGVSPIQYKNILSIQHAMYALVADPHRSIESLSAEYGFESPVYFRRLFKSITGTTPTKYRHQQTLI